MFQVLENIKYGTDKIIIEKLIELLKCYPSDMVVSACVESIDIEEHEGGIK